MDTRTEELICRVADGVATEEEQRELIMMAQREPEVAEELRRQQDAVSAVRSVGLRELQDEVAEQFVGGVYNRLERRTGWLLVSAGIAVLAAYGVYEILTEPDLGTVYRLGLAAVIVGFGLLLSSVLRMRLKTRRFDRYTEVIR